MNAIRDAAHSPLHGENGRAAPIVLFVHARPDHTQRTLEALAANERAIETDLFVFADAARSAAEAAAVGEVRAIVRRAQGFRSVEVCERLVNLGLAGSIIDGVTEVIEHYGRAIVVEDDIVTSPQFLSFMNDALDHYADELGVWHINGWAYPVATQAENRAYLTPIMECWGWATWNDRWRHFDRNPALYLGRWDDKAWHRFNIGGGYDYRGDIVRNEQGSLRTWAVFWYAAIFEHHGLCLSPPQSYVANIGIDGSGVNSGTRDIYAGDIRMTGELPEWPAAIVEDEKAWMIVRDFLLANRPWLGRRLASRVKWWIKGLLSSGRQA